MPEENLTPNPIDNAPSSIEQSINELDDHIKQGFGVFLSKQEIETQIASLNDREVVDMTCSLLRQLPADQSEALSFTADLFHYVQNTRQFLERVVNDPIKSILFYRSMSSELRSSHKMHHKLAFNPKPDDPDCPSFIKIATIHHINSAPAEPIGIATLVALSEQVLPENEYNDIAQHLSVLHSNTDIWHLSESFTIIGADGTIAEAIHEQAMERIIQEETMTKMHDTHYEAFRPIVQRCFNEIGRATTNYSSLLQLNHLAEFADPHIAELIVYGGAARTLVRAHYELLNTKHQLLSEYWQALPNDARKSLNLAIKNTKNWLSDNEVEILSLQQVPRRVSNCKYHLLREIQEALPLLTTIDPNALSADDEAHFKQLYKTLTDIADRQAYYC